MNDYDRNVIFDTFFVDKNDKSLLNYLDLNNKNYFNILTRQAIVNKFVDKDDIIGDICILFRIDIKSHLHDEFSEESYKDALKRADWYRKYFEEDRNKRIKERGKEYEKWLEKNETHTD